MLKRGPERAAPTEADIESLAELPKQEKAKRVNLNECLYFCQEHNLAFQLFLLNYDKL